MATWLACVRQIARQLVERLCVYLAFKINYRIDIDPILVPAPGIKLWMRAGTQTDITITTYQTQQKPYLFLPAIATSCFTFAPTLRNLITHPVTGAPEYSYVFRHQADFFVQLAVHRLLRGFAMLNAALRKLPRVLSHPFAPEHLIHVIRDNDADIRAVAVSVYHLRLNSFNFNALILSHFAFVGK